MCPGFLLDTAFLNETATCVININEAFSRNPWLRISRIRHSIPRPHGQTKPGTRGSIYCISFVTRSQLKEWILIVCLLFVYVDVKIEWNKLYGVMSSIKTIVGYHALRNQKRIKISDDCIKLANKASLLHLHFHFVCIFTFMRFSSFLRAPDQFERRNL